MFLVIAFSEKQDIFVTCYVSLTRLLDSWHRRSIHVSSSFLLPHSSDKRANGLVQTTSLSSPSCSSSPSLLGLSSLWPLPGGASRWVDNSSASFSWCRNLLLSECLSCIMAISFVSGCCSHSAVKKWKRMMNMLKTKRIKLKHHWLITVDINCVTWISDKYTRLLTIM